MTRAMVEEHGAWAYDNPKFLIVNQAIGGGYPQAVNGVSAPYRGTPSIDGGAYKGGKGR
jgi:hypothetical protein